LLSLLTFVLRLTVRLIQNVYKSLIAILKRK
jgi:hypothetical protein